MKKLLFMMAVLIGAIPHNLCAVDSTSYAKYFTTDDGEFILKHLRSPVSDI
jgi:hypothetical protein